MFDDIFEADFFDDDIVEEDVDMLDEDYFEAMEGPARDYRRKNNKGKDRMQIRAEREKNYHKQTHNRGSTWQEGDINKSRDAENARLRGEGVYGFQQYKENMNKHGFKATAKGYARDRKDKHRYGIYNTGPYDTLPEYNKRMGIKNGVVKPAK